MFMRLSCSNIITNYLLINYEHKINRQAYKLYIRRFSLNNSHDTLTLLYIYIISYFFFHLI